MKFFRRKYRIREFCSFAYVVECKRWWWPFWKIVYDDYQMHESMDKALDCLSWHRKNGKKSKREVVFLHRQLFSIVRI